MKTLSNWLRALWPRYQAWSRIYAQQETERMAADCAAQRAFMIWRLDPARQAAETTRYDQLNQSDTIRFRLMVLATRVRHALFQEP